eukprot:1143280-Pelagomonas_calceolata.AAC.2
MNQGKVGGKLGDVGAEVPRTICGKRTKGRGNRRGWPGEGSAEPIQANSDFPSSCTFELDFAEGG